MGQPPPQSAAQRGNSADRYRAYNFKLLINKVVEGHFTEVTGLGVAAERIPGREAGKSPIVRPIPGRVTYAPVSLRNGLTSSTIHDLGMAAVEGKVSRRNVSIVMLESSGRAEAFRWNLTNAWPQEWHGAPLDAMSRELAIETLVLAHEGLQREAS